jgi:hypothetical protein
MIINKKTIKLTIIAAIHIIFGLLLAYFALLVISVVLPFVFELLYAL